MVEPLTRAFDEYVFVYGQGLVSVPLSHAPTTRRGDEGDASASPHGLKVDTTQEEGMSDTDTPPLFTAEPAPPSHAAHGTSTTDTPRPNHVTVRVPADIQGNTPLSRYGLYTWRSAVVLARWVWWVHEKHNGIAARTVVELGAGTALPGILAARLRACPVYLTDRSDAPSVLRNASVACTLNGLTSPSVVVRPLDWGHFGTDSIDTDTDNEKDNDPATMASNVRVRGTDSAPLHGHGRVDSFDLLPPVDLVLGADVLYEPTDYEDVMVTVAVLLRRGRPGAVFATTYQNRSADRSLEPLLHRHGLACVEIPLRSVVAASDAEAADTENEIVHLLLITLVESPVDDVRDGPR
eukprot:m.226741 g.226741  ORF g.226741 m.226741 type:complete len:351 (-) comp36398_c0_seq1:121-1173(-)